MLTIYDCPCRNLHIYQYWQNRNHQPSVLGTLQFKKSKLPNRERDTGAAGHSKCVSANIDKKQGGGIRYQHSHREHDMHIVARTQTFRGKPNQL